MVNRFFSCFLLRFCPSHSTSTLHIMSKIKQCTRIKAIKNNKKIFSQKCNNVFVIKLAFIIKNYSKDSIVSLIFYYITFNFDMILYILLIFILHFIFVPVQPCGAILLALTVLIMKKKALDQGYSGLLMSSLQCVISSQAVNSHQSTISRLTRDNKTCGFTPTQLKNTHRRH